MKRNMFVSGLLVLLLAATLIPGCGNDTSTKPQNQGPSSLPEVPVPESPNDLLPAFSADHTVGISNEIGDFAPMVTEIQMMQDNGSMPWIAAGRRLILACPNVLPQYTGDPNVIDRSYITARPLLLHQRYWQKIKQVTLDPGNTSYQYEETITSGRSTSHEESREFSRTMGIEVSVGGGWGPFSAGVTASFEQTESSGEVNSVTFSEESSVTERFTVQSEPDHTIVYAIWQLVDKFSFVDADTVAINESGTLAHARIPEIASIVFPNRDTIYKSVTRFD